MRPSGNSWFGKMSQRIIRQSLHQLVHKNRSLRPRADKAHRITSYNVCYTKLLRLLLILPIAYFIIFKYLPMYGIVLSFRHYKPGGSMIGDKWMGFTYFKLFLKDPTFWNVFKNTVVLSFSALIIGFPFPIIFALLV